MRIAIVGTSNSVMTDGWVAALRGLRPDDEIDNYSIGASTSLYGSYIVDREKIADRYDVCFLDFCVNDQAYNLAGDFIFKYAVASYCGLLQKFKGTACRALPLLFPVRFAFDNRERRAVIDNAARACSAYGYPFLDILGLVDRLREGFDLSGDDLYVDGAHLRPHVAAAIAKAASAMLDGPLSLPPAAEMDAPVYFSSKPEGGTAERVGTSLVTHDVNRLSEDAQATLPAGYLCGALHWSSELSGDLFFQGNIPVRKNFRKMWDGKFFFSHFVEPLPGEKGITVTVQPIGDAVRDPTRDESTKPAASPTVDVVGYLLSDRDPGITGEALISQLQDIDPRPVDQWEIFLGDFIRRHIAWQKTRELELSQQLQQAAEAGAVFAGTSSCTIQIGDDQAVLVPVPFKSGVITLTSITSRLRAQIGYRIARPAQAELMGRDVPNLRVIERVELKGQTSFPRYFTVSVTEKGVYLENRRGAGISVTLFFAGS